MSHVFNRLVLDLETKRSFDEVGGAENRAQLGVSVVGVYDYVEDKFLTFRETQFDDLTVLLENADEVVGFNLIGFDWPVLAAELGPWVTELPTLDLLIEAQRALGTAYLARFAGTGDARYGQTRVRVGRAGILPGRRLGPARAVLLGRRETHP